MVDALKHGNPPACRFNSDLIVEPIVGSTQNRQSSPSNVHGTLIGPGGCGWTLVGELALAQLRGLFDSDAAEQTARRDLSPPSRRYVASRQTGLRGVGPPPERGFASSRAHYEKSPARIWRGFSRSAPGGI